MELIEFLFGDFWRWAGATVWLMIFVLIGLPSIVSIRIVRNKTVSGTITEKGE